jgi:hypothetical protein
MRLPNKQASIHSREREESALAVRVEAVVDRRC